MTRSRAIECIVVVALGAAVWAVVSFGASGCGEKDRIIIATVVGPDAMARIPCSASDGSVCGSESFCETTICAADAGGSCAELADLACKDDTSYGPQCGCDGLTYLNLCTRRAAGMSARSSNICDLSTPNFHGCIQGASLDTAVLKCPPRANCAAIYPQQFSTSGNGELSFFEALCRTEREGGVGAGVPGTCWVLPPTCSSRSTTLLTCKAECIDACTAIRRGGLLVPCDLDASTDD